MGKSITCVSYFREQARHKKSSTLLADILLQRRPEYPFSLLPPVGHTSNGRTWATCGPRTQTSGGNLKQAHDLEGKDIVSRYAASNRQGPSVVSTCSEMPMHSPSLATPRPPLRHTSFHMHGCYIRSTARTRHRWACIIL